jgi:hypothetical protein
MIVLCMHLCELVKITGVRLGKGTALPVNISMRGMGWLLSTTGNYPCQKRNKGPAISTGNCSCQKRDKGPAISTGNCSCQEYSKMVRTALLCMYPYVGMTAWQEGRQATYLLQSLACDPVPIVAAVVSLLLPGQGTYQSMTSLTLCCAIGCIVL